SCGSPGPWLPTCDTPGNDSHQPADSPPPESAADSGTSTRRPSSQPPHRNPATPAPDAHPAPVTADQQLAMTSGKPSNATSASPPTSSAQVKQQAEGLYLEVSRRGRVCRRTRVGSLLLAGARQRVVRRRADTGRWPS